MKCFTTILGGGGNDADDSGSDSDYVDNDDLANERSKKKAKWSNGAGREPHRL